MITVTAIALLFVTSWLAVSLHRFQTIPENVLALVNCGLAQIVFLAIFLSETFGMTTTSLLAGQGALAIGALVVWILQGRPALFPSKRPRSFSNPEVWLVVGLAAMLSALLLLNVEFYRLLPSMNKDALSYHLPRAYYWLQQGSLHYLPIDDFRWTEFPPNSSIILMWMMAAGVGYQWMHLPQVVGAVMIAIGVYRLTILCRGSRFAAASGAVICLGFPAVIYQMGTSGNDLLVGGLVVSGIAFFVQTFRPGTNNAAIMKSSSQAGIAFGLGLGMKITFLLFLPGMALFALGSVVILGWKRWGPVSWRFALIGSIGVLLLGSYSYIQNFRDHGSPMMSEATQIKLSKLPPELYSPARNIVLSFYQALCWHGFQSKATEIGPTAQREIIWAIDRTTGLGLGELSAFDNDNNLTDLFTDENRAGYGILGFLILLVAPMVGTVNCVRFYAKRSYETLLTASLIFLGLSALILFCINAPWGPTHARYLVQFIPLLVPPAICAVCGPMWLRNLSYVVFALIGLWILFYCMILEPSRQERILLVQNGKGSLQQHFDGKWVPQVNVLKAVVPSNDAIGYSGRIDSWAFVLPRELPQHRFVLLRPQEIESALNSGRVSAVVAELFSTDFTKVLPLPGTILHPKKALHVQDPKAVLLQNLKAYGLALNAERTSLVLNSEAIATFSNIHQLWPTPLPYGPLAGRDPDQEDHLQLWLPANLLQSPNVALEVRIPLDSTFPDGLISHIICNSQTVSFSVNDNYLVFQIPRNYLQDTLILQDCRIFFTRHVFALVKSIENFPEINPVTFGTPWTIHALNE